MKISARVTNQLEKHTATVQTNDRDQSLPIAPRAEGSGSSVNGGELLFLALATCYCNDIYREARKRAIEVVKVEVEVSGEFGGEGEPAKENSLSRVRLGQGAPRSHPRTHASHRRSGGDPEYRSPRGRRGSRTL